MDPSPTPPRRFSHWKTTKRTFTFGKVIDIKEKTTNAPSTSKKISGKKSLQKMQEASLREENDFKSHKHKKSTNKSGPEIARVDKEDSIEPSSGDKENKDNKQKSHLSSRKSKDIIEIQTLSRSFRAVANTSKGKHSENDPESSSSHIMELWSQKENKCFPTKRTINESHLISSALEYGGSCAKRVKKGNESNSLDATGSTINNSLDVAKLSRELKQQSSISVSPNNHILNVSADRSLQLRDRTMLHSPDNRQYPLTFYYSKKKLDEISGTDSSHSSFNTTRNGGKPKSKKQEELLNKSNLQQDEDSTGTDYVASSKKQTNINAKQALICRHESYKVNEHTKNISANSTAEISSNCLPSQKEKKNYRDKKTNASVKKLAEDKSRSLQSKERRQNIEISDICEQDQTYSSGDKNLSLSKKNHSNPKNNLKNVQLSRSLLYNSLSGDDQQNRVKSRAKNVDSGKKKHKAQTLQLPTSHSKQDSGDSSKKGVSIAQDAKQKIKKNNVTESMSKNKSPVGIKEPYVCLQDILQQREKELSVTLNISSRNIKTSTSKPVLISESNIEHTGNLRQKNALKKHQNEPLNKPSSQSPQVKSSQAKQPFNLGSSKSQLTESSLNATALASQKVVRRRNLVKDLVVFETHEDTGSSQKNKKELGRSIQVFCKDGRSRPGSVVTAYDVILETLESIEHSLKEDNLNQGLITEIMDDFRNQVENLLLKHLDLKDLKMEMKKIKTRYDTLKNEFSQVQKQNIQMSRHLKEISRQQRDVNLQLASLWMNDYMELMENLDSTSG